MPSRQRPAMILRQPAAGFPPPAGRRTPGTLEEALRSGPFHTALRFAIAANGLSLEGLRRRLSAEGHVVSLSALSYWQRGLRRPERAESVRAVYAIERLLGLRRSSLVVLLGPPRPRGRTSARVPAPLQFSDAMGPGLATAAALEGLDAAVNSGVQHVSVHNDRVFGAGRGWLTERIRRVVTAQLDGADRFVAFSVPDMANEQPPLVQPLTGCRLGRVRADPPTGLLAAELLFDLPLRRGQSHVFEYESIARGETAGITQWIAGTRYPLRELVLRAHFDPPALPVRCYHVRRARFGAPWRELAEVPITPGGTANLVSLDVPPGLEGFRWEWD